MKPKTKAFIDKIASNPKISATKAYLETHETTNAASARASASKLLATPSVRLYMDEHVYKARNRIVDLIDSDKEEIALRAADSVLDRQLGRPTQRVETSSNIVYVNIDMTQNHTPGQRLVK